MKAKLEFDLPDEQYEYSCATKGVKLWSLIKEIDTELRSLIKYDNGFGKSSDEFSKMSPGDSASFLRNWIWESFSDEGICFGNEHP